jgi:hypothetical protein
VPAVRIVPASSRRASVGTRERRKADGEALAAAPPYPCRRSLLYTFPPYFCASRGSRRPLSRRAGPGCGQGSEDDGEEHRCPERERGRRNGHPYGPLFEY